MNYVLCIWIAEHQIRFIFVYLINSIVYQGVAKLKRNCENQNICCYIASTGMLLNSSIK